MNKLMAAKPENQKATSPRETQVLTIGNTCDTELVRHTYATSGKVDELEKLVSDYLDDCECDYDWPEVEEVSDMLKDYGHARFGNHFFSLTELENA